MLAPTERIGVTSIEHLKTKVKLMNGIERQKGVKTMRRNIRLCTLAITLTLLLTVIGTTSYGAPLGPEEDMQRINSTVLDELNIIQGSMGAIYQAMYVLLEQAHEMKRDRLQELKVSNIQKLEEAKKEADAKKLETKERIRAAKQEFVTHMIMASASCAVVVDGVTKAENNLKFLYSAPDKQKVQRFTANADILKRKLAKLNGEVNRLRDMLNSGKIDSVPIDDLKKLKTQFHKSLQHIHRINRFTVEKIKRRRGIRGSSRQETKRKK